MIISFFGHSRLIITDSLERKLYDFFENTVPDNPIDVYLGGIGAFDEFAYSFCKRYKCYHPNVSLNLITPYITLEYQRNHLEYENRRYDTIIYPEIEDKPLKYAIFYRNRWMVDKSDYVICAVNHDWGGAYKAYLYAKRKGKKIVNLTEWN